ncbi:hypothetical protein SFRURICE_003815, partial [Spodoptera frugiperda]
YEFALRLTRSKRENVRRSGWLVDCSRPITAPNPVSFRFRSTTSLIYVEQKVKENAFGALIGGIIRTDQSERRTRSRFVFVQRKANSYLRLFVVIADC